METTKKHDLFTTKSSWIKVDADYVKGVDNISNIDYIEEHKGWIRVVYNDCSTEIYDKASDAWTKSKTINELGILKQDSRYLIFPKVELALRYKKKTNPIIEIIRLKDFKKVARMNNEITIELFGDKRDIDFQAMLNGIFIDIKKNKVLQVR